MYRKPDKSRKTTPLTEIQNSLTSLRRKRGISAARLAESVGISRQTIYAIEADSFAPNTAVALRLARALEVSVEQVFTLADSSPAPRSEEDTRCRFD